MKATRQQHPHHRPRPPRAVPSDSCVHRGQAPPRPARLRGPDPPRGASSCRSTPTSPPVWPTIARSRCSTNTRTRTSPSACCSPSIYGERRRGDRRRRRPAVDLRVPGRARAQHHRVRRPLRPRRTDRRSRSTVAAGPRSLRLANRIQAKVPNAIDKELRAADDASTDTIECFLAVERPRRGNPDRERHRGEPCRVARRDGPNAPCCAALVR